MNKDIKVSFRLTPNEYEKLAFLARHDDTSIGHQLRQAVKTYAHNRKRTVFPGKKKNPIVGD